MCGGRAFFWVNAYGVRTCVPACALWRLACDRGCMHGPFLCPGVCMGGCIHMNVCTGYVAYTAYAHWWPCCQTGVRISLHVMHIHLLPLKKSGHRKHVKYGSGSEIARLQVPLMSTEEHVPDGCLSIRWVKYGRTVVFTAWSLQGGMQDVTCGAPHRVTCTPQCMAWHHMQLTLCLG